MNMDLQEIRNQLPHGAIKEIANRVDLTASTITLFFKGKCKTPKAPDILNAAAEILIEFKTKEQDAINKLKQLCRES